MLVWLFEIPSSWIIALGIVGLISLGPCLAMWQEKMDKDTEAARKRTKALREKTHRKKTEESRKNDRTTTR